MIVSFESSFKRSLHLRNAGFTTVRKSFHCEGYSPFFSQRWCVWAGFRLVFGGAWEMGFDISELPRTGFQYIHWGCKAKNLHFYSLQYFESCLLVTPIFSAFLIRCVDDSFFPSPFFCRPHLPNFDSPLRPPHCMRNTLRNRWKVNLDRATHPSRYGSWAAATEIRGPYTLRAKPGACSDRDIFTLSARASGVTSAPTSSHSKHIQQNLGGASRPLARLYWCDRASEELSPQQSALPLPR